MRRSQTDDSGEKPLSITWQKHLAPGSYVDLPGVYCLHSNQTQWPEEQLWRTYRMLTDLEAVFRCFKSDRGFRPIFHRKEERADSYLFITVLAYQFVQLIRRRLKASDSNANSSYESRGTGSQSVTGR
ncbi:MAG TPA: hypothetical protein VLR89_00890 [Anaerolineaceae bacterium]|nr:hypothetical protein [Anaerolineaceae bacterium]